ncbi:MAG: acetyl-CoA carboxylase biotin carboxylase subunit [Saprospiraceae bacterium]
MNKILIANRGEIALRIMRTAKNLGIGTVAVYSDVDRLAPHVLFADQAINIGAAAAKDSYLRMDKIIDAAKKTACDAIHPGYGFLSENPVFADLVAQEGLNFIGPPSSAMIKMGSKIEAKKTATEVGVPLVPGTHTAINSIQEAKEIAKKTSYPLLIKASAGGGGKGMRLVNDESELEEQMKLASSEALSAFGDGAVFIEKYIANPKHIEFQIFCDKHQNAVYLFERECSVQRRHQKLVEEAPSSCLNENVRVQMGKDAVKLAMACGYVGAGTIEFLVDDELNYYFLEMNTRLQVEHPVTEMITGLDLVELQIRIAEGEKIPFTQDSITINGHAIEIRICAEDSYNNFMPSIGIINTYISPTGPGIRLDDSYKKGMEIPVQYDPMIGKLIAHGNNRQEAIKKLSKAINEMKIEGVDTTLPFCNYVLHNKEFLSGNYNTNFVSRYYEEFLSGNFQTEIQEAGAYIALQAYLEKIKLTSPKEIENINWSIQRKKLY